MRTTVSRLMVGDRVKVAYPGGPINTGTVYFIGKGYTAAKREDGSSFKVSHFAAIELLAKATEVAR